MNFKLKSFVLIDIIIAMAISTMVVGVAYTAFNITNFQFNYYKQINDEIVNLMQLNDILQDDFEKAELIKFSNYELQVILKDKRLLTYQFEQDYIIRNTDIIQDTFYYKAGNLESYYNKQTQSSGIIDKFTFENEILDNTIKFNYYKQYGVDILMEIEQNNK